MTISHVFITSLLETSASTILITISVNSSNGSSLFLLFYNRPHCISVRMIYVLDILVFSYRSELACSDEDHTRNETSRERKMRASHWFMFAVSSRAPFHNDRRRIEKTLPFTKASPCFVLSL